MTVIGTDELPHLRSGTRVCLPVDTERDGAPSPGGIDGVMEPTDGPERLWPPFLRRVVAGLHADVRVGLAVLLAVELAAASYHLAFSSRTRLLIFW